MRPLRALGALQEPGVAWLQPTMIGILWCLCTRVARRRCDLVAASISLSVLQCTMLAKITSTAVHNCTTDAFACTATRCNVFVLAALYGAHNVIAAVSLLSCGSFMSEIGGNICREGYQLSGAPALSFRSMSRQSSSSGRKADVNADVFLQALGLTNKDLAHKRAMRKSVRTHWP